MNRWGLVTQIVVTGVLLIVLACMVVQERDQAVLGWVYLALALVAWIVGALAGRIVGWLTR